ncbi:DNA segregation ATPase FtsK/SpoIIIE, S-DNA-T family [Prevotellaceae bacterium HUN156]|nr:DNA segregation ATPase FtsK/SpoIIIE, S-DNA-T family [Prevotellaceae bacterium HUN156]
MAKKKTTKASEKTASSLREALGIDKIFFNERINFVIGFCLLIIAGYLTWAFVSYFTTGAADQSLLESPRDGEIMNQAHEFRNSCGSLGAYAAHFFIKRCFGLAAFLIPIFMLMVSVTMMRAYKVRLLKWFMALTLVMIWASVTMAKFLEPLFVNACFNPGGDHGLAICQGIEGLLGVPGLTALLGLIAVAFFVYLSMETVIILRKIINPLHYLKKIPMEINIGRGDSEDDKNGINTLDDPTVFDDPQSEVVEFDDIEDEGETSIIPTETINTIEPREEEAPADSDIEIEVDTGIEEEAAHGKTLNENYGDLSTPYDPKRDLENYRYPTLDLLQKYESDGKPYVDMVEQNTNKNRIVDVLRNFGVEISSIKATVGPTITLYEITPAPGVRISRIRNLEDDIALSLSALGIRIIAPIPGKGTIGIEVPNAKPATVSMESILNSKKFQESTMELPCAVGKTITNEVFMFDLAKAPHLLVAGATGQGKSVGLNAIITSLLYKKHPAELKIVLVDPKKVEFSVYSTIEKHFLAKVPDDEAEPIITDVTKVVRTLNSLCKEMDTRYDLLKQAQARNIKEYNKKFIERHLNPEHGHRFMPYIVVVIDEFGDLIMTAGKEVELPIARIAQLARAVGIHMIIATQRPTTNIITGTIKANFPSRIAFRVGAMIDSRTILDRPGAQQLVGRGDMLYLNGGEPIRVQCAFVDTPEVERINQFISQQQGYTSAFELPEPDMDEGEAGESRDVDMQHLDPMFEDAARLIVREQSGSTSLIQRKFAIGYNRAGRLMDQLEKAGIVGAAHGSKPREVLLMDENSLENLLAQWK